MKNASIVSRALLALSLPLALAACGASVGPEDLPMGDAAVRPTDGPNTTPTPAVDPRTVVVPMNESELDLATGRLVPQGDLRLFSGHGVGFLVARHGGCFVGSFRSLAEVPTSDAACMTGSSMFGSSLRLVDLVGSMTSDAIGTSFLVRDAAMRRYRLRVVAITTTYANATVTFEYAPIP
jgi:hypothetical protein